MKNRNEILWSSNELSKILNINISKDLKFYKIEMDSRKIKKDYLFLALEGKKLNGHDFLQDAINYGATGLIVSRSLDTNIYKSHIIKVKDVYESMLLIAKASRNRINNINKSNIIAITGSSGKTSTKEMLKSALSKIANVYANQDSYNNYMGVPYSLINMPKETKSNPNLTKYPIIKAR